MSNCFADFLQQSGLYDSIDINRDNIKDLCELIGGKVKISEYCMECGEKRVYSMSPIEFLFNAGEHGRHLCNLADKLEGLQKLPKICSTSEPSDEDWYWTNCQIEDATRVMIFPFTCAMNENHHLDYVVITIGKTMIKIGQYPSVADLYFPNLKQYNKDIDKQSLKELKRAIGLHAQGIGVGSYVYLRRIFERIVEKAKQQAEADQKIDLSEYNKMKVPERIKLLKDYLPEMISSNPVIYGIVSKGIHELSEEECIKYFPVMKDCIIIILDQWEQKRREQENIKKLGTSLASISSQISQ